MLLKSSRDVSNPAPSEKLRTPNVDPPRLVVRLLALDDADDLHAIAFRHREGNFELAARPVAHDFEDFPQFQRTATLKRFKRGLRTGHSAHVQMLMYGEGRAVIVCLLLMENGLWQPYLS